MLIRQYCDSDLEAFTNLMNQWSDDGQYTQKEISDSIESMRKNTENKIFIAEDKTGIAGYISTSICYYPGHNPFAEVLQLLVDKNHRNKGIGTALIGFVEKYYLDQGIKEIRLHSRIDRDRAHNFYRMLGFKEFKQSKFFIKDIG